MVSAVVVHAHMLRGDSKHGGCCAGAGHRHVMTCRRPQKQGENGERPKYATERG